jgi:hypothetical protein
VAPTVADPGDHIIARIMAVRGCINTGNPWDVTATGTELVSDISVSIPGATTTVDSCLVLAAVATGTDVSSSSHFSLPKNATLQDCTERMDSWTAEGGGGGFAVVAGVKLIAGAIDATTAVVATANFKALMTIALKPETGGNFLNHVGLYDVWARVYTTSEEPPWLRLVYDVGDLVAPTENVQVRVPNAGGFYLVHLGQINLKQAAFGTHRWAGEIQSYGEIGAENVAVDKLWFFNADEGSGILKGAPAASTFGRSSTSVGRDDFNQAAGELTGKTADVGGVWSGAGDNADFEVVE